MTSEWMEWHWNEKNDTRMMEKGQNGLRLMEWHQNECNEGEYNDILIWNDEMTGGIGKFTY